MQPGAWEGREGGKKSGQGTDDAGAGSLRSATRSLKQSQGPSSGYNEPDLQLASLCSSPHLPNPEPLPRWLRLDSASQSP